MKKHNPSLVVESSYPDLVINVGEVTLGEGNRKKLQKTQRDQEKEKVARAACALLNSGGGVIRMEMANRDEHPVEMGQDLEESLRTLTQSSDFQDFFETKQHGRCFYIFVKSWNTDFSPEDRFKPRICSLDSSLHRRFATKVLLMDSREAFNFLENKKRNAKFLGEEPSSKILRDANQNFHDSNPAHLIFQKDQLEHGEILPFPESQYVEFKQFSTENALVRIKEMVPKYIAAFANTKGGYLFIGVEDKSRKVLGCAEKNIKGEDLEKVIEEAINKLPRAHFCQSKCQITFTVRFLNVLSKEELKSYVCVIRVEPFCGAVFSEAPRSWMVKDGEVCCLTTEEWIDMMTDTDPELQNLSEDFESQLSLSSRPPRSSPVYSKKGLEYKEDLQRLLFSVSSVDLQFTPESLLEELCSEYEGLEELIKKQIHPFSRGILILSRSWAVDLNLQEKQGVICDALLVTQNSPPILYTILREQDADGQLYCTRTAFTLKQKLVNMGCYTGKLCVMAKVLHLSPESNAESFEGSDSLIKYPKSYYLADTEEMEALLQSLVIVLLSFRSFLSDQLGCEILNLLTVQQYEIISKNLHKTPELFIHGLPGSGKTIVAMKIIEKIKNTMGCEINKILYVCENQPLRDLTGKKGICRAVTRKAFMKINSNFENIQHIIIDEAQNFQTEDGDWYEKAKTITRRGKGGPGILWIFLDYFQTSHVYHSGLPDLQDQYPREELIRMVRNAEEIANYLKEIMHKVRENPPPNIPSESLNIFSEAEWSRGVPGNFNYYNYKDMEQLVHDIEKQCHLLLKAGYSCKDIAVICNTVEDVQEYKSKLESALRKRKRSRSREESNLLVIEDASAITGNHIVLDSVRRFSGLERNIVFGIIPKAAQPAFSYSLLLCLASRARKYLYIFIPSEEMTNSASF
ncbi:schlafen family member 11 isoform X2 [Pipistrellus kuhlii]|uniref:Schlafen family member 11 n=2 Tax=Pipistrellus kuhlii TaxID=59472 RepID=A0A7J7U8V2_PIPKU|nr:schlafen family member 11 isoform X2 [Pipistrellus kuhlii]XP_045442110.1 schlafen family member 11 isoform X2 [Pipistrellus kuhlii]XP_045442111.1 schlafen family member 11 isoform X2 [Pipistrellus kuhlii]XP_045442112.1 schlafen family member 11 isoform X2 [Pipistrellus kuhlii]XP_045442113.1 schlafen family member 11 isoform X2 [Pipistrellus kuhlii]KAF6309300.1 schlafen family member 11 [Pipistrellus kuhlii]